MLVSPKAKQLGENCELLGASTTIEPNHPVFVLFRQCVTDLRGGKGHCLIQVALGEELQCGQRAQVLCLMLHLNLHSHAKRQLHNVNHEITRIKSKVVDRRLRLQLCHNGLLDPRTI